MATQKNRAAAESLGFLAIIAGVCVVLNILSGFMFTRLDCTANENYSLSEGSERLASNLTDKLVITAYFTANLPPPFNATETYVRDMLTEYEAASNGMIEVTFIAPDSDSEREAAEEDGIQKVAHQAFKDDGATVVEGYRGLVMEYLDQREVIPVIQDTAGLEYALTMKIKKMSGERTVIGIMSGHESPTRTEGLAHLTACLPTYDIREVSADSAIDSELEALLVVEPGTELSEAELQNINSFVMSGKNLGVFGPSMRVNLGGGQAPPVATPSESGLNRLLRHWGVVGRDGLVHDANCQYAPLRTPIGQIPVPHPPVPQVNFDEDQSEHLVLFRIDGAPFPFTAPLEMVEVPEGVNASVLARSSENSWLVTGDSIALEPRDPREWRATQAGAETGPFPLLIALEGTLPSAFSEGEAAGSSENEVKVLISGGSFALRDEALPAPPQGGGECQMTSNLALALNAVDWLSADEDLIAIRAKNVEDPQIDQPRDLQGAQDAFREAAAQAETAEDQEERDQAIEEAEAAEEDAKAAIERYKTTKSWVKYGNMFGVPFLLGAFGIFWWRRRKSASKRVEI